MVIWAMNVSFSWSKGQISCRVALRQRLSVNPQKLKASHKDDTKKRRHNHIAHDRARTNRNKTTVREKKMPPLCTAPKERISIYLSTDFHSFGRVHAVKGQRYHRLKPQGSCHLSAVCDTLRTNMQNRVAQHATRSTASAEASPMHNFMTGPGTHHCCLASRDPAVPIHITKPQNL